MRYRLTAMRQYMPLTYIVPLSGGVYHDPESVGSLSLTGVSTDAEHI